MKVKLAPKPCAERIRLPRFERFRHALGADGEVASGGRRPVGGGHVGHRRTRSAPLAAASGMVEGQPAVKLPCRREVLHESCALQEPRRARRASSSRTLPCRSRARRGADRGQGGGAQLLRHPDHARQIPGKAGAAVLAVGRGGGRRRGAGARRQRREDRRPGHGLPRLGRGAREGRRQGGFAGRHS